MEVTSRNQRACAKCGRVGCKLYRLYGSFLRDSEIVCGADIPEEQRGWYVPLFEDVNGDVWGYTSVRSDAMYAWLKLDDDEVPNGSACSVEESLIANMRAGDERIEQLEELVRELRAKLAVRR